MNYLRLLLFTLILSNFQTAISQNVLISNSLRPNEPSIMMNPNNTDILVAGANINRYYTSDDGGYTWTSNILESNYGVWGDPVIDVDTLGNFYFFHLSNPTNGNWIDRIVCQKSSDNGATWTSGTFTGLNGAKVQDKHWSIVDRTNNNIYLTWTQFDAYGSELVSDSTHIMFSKSLDGGNTWSTAKRINKYGGDCIDDDNTVEGAVPAVGPNGEIYVSWSGPNGIVFNRSTDEGETWLTEEIEVDPMPGGWAYTIPGIFRANGMPVTKCDLSGGPNHGTIYINWSDQRNGLSDTDIWMVKSTDHGDTWSDPIRVNDDPAGKHQFFTWFDIDQSNGKIYVVFYDRRNYTDLNTDVYLAISEDGGTTFQNRRISESPFVPNANIFFGDYTNITAHNNIVRPIWTRLHAGLLSIWTDVTPVDQLLSIEDPIDLAQQNEVKNYPNPASHLTYVSFKLHERSNILLELFDQKGVKLQTIIDHKEMDYGKHIIPININELNLMSGTYYYKLHIDGKSKTLKNLVIK